MTEEQLRRVLKEELNQQLAVFYDQMTHHAKETAKDLRNELKSDVSRIYNLVDGLTKRVTDDEQERAAMGLEQNRHKDWIGQLAKKTNTKLVPEL